ncbi:MAG: hypothetical protein EYX74_04395 [Desulfobulbaceae bacterium]|nr:MAG: hypothetical protein EYX74_04395 [Desulfobulbaceae bacterium]
MKYWFMDQYRSTHGVQRMCRVIGASRSGYYSRKIQPQSKRQKENEKILMEIRESHKNSRRAYGSPRITEDLQAKGTRCGENRVARLMKIHGIVAKTAKKFKATTNSKHNLPVAPNLLSQNFEVEKPNTVWVSDITYIATMEGWLYLMEDVTHDGLMGHLGVIGVRVVDGVVFALAHIGRKWLAVVMIALSLLRLLRLPFSYEVGDPRVRAGGVVRRIAQI